MALLGQNNKKLKILKLSPNSRYLQKLAFKSLWALICRIIISVHVMPFRQWGSIPYHHQMIRCKCMESFWLILDAFQYRHWVSPITHTLDYHVQFFSHYFWKSHGDYSNCNFQSWDWNFTKKDQSRFPITNAQWVQLLVSFKQWYESDAYPSRDGSEKRCNCVYLTSTNSLSLRQQSTLTSSSLGSSSSQCFHWVFSVSSVKSSRPSLLLLGVWNNSLALMMYGAMNLSFLCSFCVTGWGHVHFEVKAILYLSISSNGAFFILFVLLQS